MEPVQILKDKPHFYHGNDLMNINCIECGKEAQDHIHYRNAGIICDNPNGPCGCGSWHKSKTENNLAE